MLVLDTGSELGAQDDPTNILAVAFGGQDAWL
jgi:hypothetical protein